MDNIKELICNVRIERMKSKNNPSANPEYDINSILRNIINNRFFESDYNRLTIKLLYEEFPYDKAIEEGILEVLNKNVF